METEQTNTRQKCDWPVANPDKGSPKGSTVPCGSEERVFNVKGYGGYTGRPRETPICEKHLPQAWKKWRVESAEPLCPSPRDSVLMRICRETLKRIAGLG